jgi:DNA mismatch repair protein MutS2
MSSRFRPGDRVHVAGLGAGVVRETRNGGRYLIEWKGRTLVIAAAELETAPTRRTRKSDVDERAVPPSGASARSASIDLHGKTVEEALAALDEFLNDAMLAGAETGTVIHGRSGGKLKTAVHGRLKALPTVRAFRLDPRNPGVTILTF